MPGLDLHPPVRNAKGDGPVIGPVDEQAVAQRHAAEAYRSARSGLAGRGCRAHPVRCYVRALRSHHRGTGDQEDHPDRAQQCLVRELPRQTRAKQRAGDRGGRADREDAPVGRVGRQMPDHPGDPDAEADRDVRADGTGRRLADEPHQRGHPQRPEDQPDDPAEDPDRRATRDGGGYVERRDRDRASAWEGACAAGRRRCRAGPPRSRTAEGPRAAPRRRSRRSALPRSRAAPSTQTGAS